MYQGISTKFELYICIHTCMHAVTIMCIFINYYTMELDVLPVANITCTMKETCC